MPRSTRTPHSLSSYHRLTHSAGRWSRLATGPRRRCPAMHPRPHAHLRRHARAIHGHGHCHGDSGATGIATLGVLVLPSLPQPPASQTSQTTGGQGGADSTGGQGLGGQGADQDDQQSQQQSAAVTISAQFRRPGLRLRLEPAFPGLQRQHDHGMADQLGRWSASRSPSPAPPPR